MSQRIDKCLFLYTEMAGYMLSCLKTLARDANVEVHVIMYPVNPVAPFQFSLNDTGIHFYERKKYSDKSLVELCRKISPAIIFCGGWIDKGYLEVCRQFKNHIKTVLTLDNPWRNTMRQHIAALIGPFWLKKYFTHCWVAGAPQKEYALRLGFRASNIKEGVYSCDFEYFHGLYMETREQKKSHFPHRIIFVGRYTRLKGVKELWEGFTRFHEKNSSDWELWCLGKGEFEPEFPSHPMIKNFGFVQPSEMRSFIAQTGIFILPSHYEHWGVVVHEFAAAGFPLLCSTTTSAATKFLHDGKNGFLHEPCSSEAITEAFEKITALPSEALTAMGEESITLAATVTPAKWCNTVHEFISG